MFMWNMKKSFIPHGFKFLWINKLIHAERYVLCVRHTLPVDQFPECHCEIRQRRQQVSRGFSYHDQDSNMGFSPNTKHTPGCCMYNTHQHLLGQSTQPGPWHSERMGRHASFTPRTCVLTISSDPIYRRIKGKHFTNKRGSICTNIEWYLRGIRWKGDSGIYENHLMYNCAHSPSLKLLCVWMNTYECKFVKICIFIKGHFTIHG